MIQKPIFLILTDSIALPRKYDQGIVLWNETYIAKLRTTYLDYEVINVSIGGASIKDLRNQLNYYKIFKPKIVLLQCGIVDAAPRAFGRIEMELIKKLRLFRLTKPFVEFLRKFRSHHYTSLREFESNLLVLKNTLQANRFLALEILPSCESYEKQLPGITQSIEAYNKVLHKHTSIIDLKDIPREGILTDFHHINAIGHQYIFEQLQKQLL